MGKKVIFLICLLAIMLPTNFTYAQNNSLGSKQIILKLDSIEAKVNGQTTSLTVPPTLFGSTTMVPLRFVSEALGAEVVWKEDKQEITIKYQKDIMTLVINEKKASLSGKLVDLDEAATIKNGSTLVPLRFIAENLHQKVAFNATTNEITLQDMVTVDPLPPEKKLIAKPAVDNLSQSLWDAAFGSGPWTRMKTLGMVTTNDHRTFILASTTCDTGRCGTTNFGIYQYNSTNDDGLRIKMILNDSFNFQYSDLENKKHSIIYPELVPAKLFYDDIGNKVYMLSAVKSSMDNITQVIHEIYPNVGMVAYHTADRTTYQNSNFFVTPDGQHFYFSDAAKKSIVKADRGGAANWFGELPLPENIMKENKISVVKQDTMYVFSQELKSLYKLFPSGSLQLILKLDIGNITSIAARDGSFYYISDNKLFILSTDGATTQLVDFLTTIVNNQLYKPSTKTYEEFVTSYTAEVPHDVELFTCDEDGNIIFLNGSAGILRRINLYQK